MLIIKQRGESGRGDTEIVPSIVPSIQFFHKFKAVLKKN